jgi:hypothetical protein
VTGDHTATTCKFQVFENLYVDLYFDDTAGPQDTTINGGPAQGSTTGSTSATFTSFGAASDPDATFQCRLDPPGGVGSFGSCPKNGAFFNNLTQNGTWTLHVRGVDPSGNVDPTPASRSWTVDTTPPTTSISGGPTAGSTTNSASAAFSLSASESATFQCKLDGPAGPGAFSSCTSTPAYNSLPDGTYTFSARATDSVGNMGDASSRTWTVDRTPPNTSISSGPSGPTNSTTAAFNFSATGGAVSYECRLSPTTDWEPCSTGRSYSSLVPGTYTFSVRATDAAGNVEDTPASHTFTVDTQPPDTSIDSGPSGDTNSNSATFTFSATEPNVTFECRLDTGAWESCSSGNSYSSLGQGMHTFYVRGTDAAGNVESSEASRSWNITSPPSDSGGIQPGGNQPGGNQPGGNQPGGTTPADTAGPLAVFSYAKQRLARVLKKGLATSASSTEAGKLRLDVLYKGKKVATASRALGAPGSTRLVAKFTAKWKRKLGHLRSAKLTIRLTATDLVGNATVKKKTVTLRR